MSDSAARMPCFAVRNYGTRRGGYPVSDAQTPQERSSDDFGADRTAAASMYEGTPKPHGIACRCSECRPEYERLIEALERTDQALRAVLAGTPVRDSDEILSANAWLLFAQPEVKP